MVKYEASYTGLSGISDEYHGNKMEKIQENEDHDKGTSANR